jgi:hypothetical protein
MAMKGNKTVQEVDTAALAEKLRTQGAVLEYVPSPQGGALNGARARQ